LLLHVTLTSRRRHVDGNQFIWFTVAGNVNSVIQTTFHLTFLFLDFLATSIVTVLLEKIIYRKKRMYKRFTDNCTPTSQRTKHNYRGRTLSVREIFREMVVVWMCFDIVPFAYQSTQKNLRPDHWAVTSQTSIHQT